MIKVWDYLKEYEELREEVLNEIDGVFKRGTLVFGPKTTEFEEKFSTYSDSEFGLGVSCGTDALYVAMMALGIGEGDEVLIQQFLLAQQYL